MVEVLEQYKFYTKILHEVVEDYIEIQEIYDTMMETGIL